MTDIKLTTQEALEHQEVIAKFRMAQGLLETMTYVLDMPVTEAGQSWASLSKNFQGQIIKAHDSYLALGMPSPFEDNIELIREQYNYDSSNASPKKRGVLEVEESLAKQVN